MTELPANGDKSSRLTPVQIRTFVTVISVVVAVVLVQPVIGSMRLSGLPAPSRPRAPAAPSARRRAICRTTRIVMRPGLTAGRTSRGVTPTTTRRWTGTVMVLHASAAVGKPLINDL